MDFRLVNGLVLLGRQLFPEYEKSGTLATHITLKLEYDRLRVGLLFFASDTNFAIVLSSWIYQWLDQSLIFGSDDLVKLELEVADILLSFKVVRLLVVIHIISFNVVGLRLFEEVVHVEISHKMRVEVVVNTLSAAYQLFDLAAALLLYFVQENKGICLRKRIQVG